MFSISVRSNAKQLGKSLDAFIHRQLPFAIAQGINRTAARVAEGESENIKKTFANPTPFTQKSVGVRRARKGAPTAIIYMKDVAAAYLQPYETGGVHKLAGRALLNPKDIKLNGYGQLSRGTLAKLKGRKGIFVGPVKMKNGDVINGIWQRPALVHAETAPQLRRAVKQWNGGRLKLLIRFGDALPVNKQLNWGKRAKQIVDQWIDRDLADALKAANATAR